MHHEVSTDLLDQTQAAQYLGVKPSTLERWRFVGAGPKFCKVGRLVRYRRAALEAYLNERTRTSTHADPLPQAA